MRLSDSQHGVLHSLAEFGPQEAVEVHGPRGMDGKRKVKLEWRGTPLATLVSLENAGLISVARRDPKRPVNAVGKRGNPRVEMIISITEAGRAAIGA